jgi:hypothetical protein
MPVTLRDLTDSLGGRLAGLFLAFGVGVVTTACSDDSADESDAPPVPDDIPAALGEAVELTRAVESASLRYELSLQAEGEDDMAIDAEGAMTADGVADITIAGRGVGEDESALRSDGDTAWLRTDREMVRDELPDGVEWVEAPYQEFVDDEIVFGLADVWDVLPVLRGLEDPKDDGAEEVGETTVRLLRGDVDLGAALEAASPTEREGLEAALTAEPDEIGSFDATVGLDEEGRVRVLRLEIESDSSVGDVTLGMVLTATALDQPVQAPEPPPEDETVRIDEIPGLQAILAGES